jgi:hypothetical protein
LGSAKTQWRQNHPGGVKNALGLHEELVKKCREAAPLRIPQLMAFGLAMRGHVYSGVKVIHAN